MPSGVTKTKYDAAKCWLALHLADGAPHIAGGVIASGFMQGFGEQTIRRAARALGVYKTAANVGPVRRPGTSTELWYLTKEAGE
jgi:hypothetical protein